jgi:hypothetical protein
LSFRRAPFYVNPQGNTLKNMRSDGRERHSKGRFQCEAAHDLHRTRRTGSSQGSSHPLMI